MGKAALLVAINAVVTLVAFLLGASAGMTFLACGPKPPLWWQGLLAGVNLAALASWWVFKYRPAPSERLNLGPATYAYLIGLVPFFFLP